MIIKVMSTRKLTCPSIFHLINVTKLIISQSLHTLASLIIVETLYLDKWVTLYGIIEVLSFTVIFEEAPRDIK